MSLRGCFGCLKFFVFVVNFLFWLFGLGVMAVSLWLLFDQQLYMQSIGAQQNDYYVGTYIILAVGGIMTLVGFLGCCGAWKESTWMLGTFFIFLIIIFLGEIALGVLIYFNEAPYQRVIKKSVYATVTKKYHVNATATTQTFDLIQEGFHCCGAEGPLDWADSVYNSKGFIYEAPEIGISSRHSSSSSLSTQPSPFRVPKSCCVTPDSDACTQARDNIDPDRIGMIPIWEEGCSQMLILFVEQSWKFLLAVAGGILLIQLLGMLFSLCLCCALKRIDDLKA